MEAIKNTITGSSLFSSITGFFGKKATAQAAPTVQEEKTKTVAKTALVLLQEKHTRDLNRAIEISIGLPEEQFDAKIKPLQKKQAKEVLKTKERMLTAKIKELEEKILHTTSSTEAYDEAIDDLIFTSEIVREAILAKYTSTISSINNS